MSKKNLEKILDEISNKVHSARDSLNDEAHIYSVSYPKIVKEVLYEINSTKIKVRFPLNIVRDHVKTYCESVYKEFKKGIEGFSVQVGGNPYSFSVLIRKKSGNTNKNTVFYQIGQKRNKALDTLRRSLVTEMRNYLLIARKRKLSDAEEDTITSISFGSKNKNNRRTGGLLERGHTAGGSAVEHELLANRMAFSDEIRTLMSSSNSKVVESILMELDFKIVTNPKQHGLLRNGKLVVTIYDQSKKRNNAQSNEEESNIRKNFQRVIKEVLDRVDFANLETSPNVPKLAVAKLGKAAKKAGLKTNIDTSIANKTYNTTSSRTIKGKLLTSTISDSLSNAVKFNFIESNTAAKKRNWSSLIPILNARLAEQVRSNMQSPRLINRTGRFADSVRVTGVVETPQGYPSFIFDYERDPYNVFDPILGKKPWNTPERNPRDLINMSIREILRELAVDRFYTRRA